MVVDSVETLQKELQVKKLSIHLPKEYEIERDIK